MRCDSVVAGCDESGKFMHNANREFKSDPTGINILMRCRDSSELSPGIVKFKMLKW